LNVNTNIKASNKFFKPLIKFIPCIKDKISPPITVATIPTVILTKIFLSEVFFKIFILNIHKIQIFI
jgi:hypothetical protein